jgi:hypothetical protein
MGVGVGVAVVVDGGEGGDGRGRGRGGSQLEEICARNKLPPACNPLEATRKNAGKISMQEHETIMEEAERRDRLEYNNNDGSEEVKGEVSDDKEDECESNLEL